MPVRDAVETDNSDVALLIQKFYDEAPYKAPKINYQKTFIILDAMAANVAEGNDDVFFKVMEVDDDVVGFILAERFNDLWSDEQIVFEYFMYVLPAFRGRLGAGQMMLKFKVWAESKPAAIRAQASSGINDDTVRKAYEKFGWGPRGQLYGKEVF